MPGYPSLPALKPGFRLLQAENHFTTGLPDYIVLSLAKPVNMIILYNYLNLQQG